MLQGISRSSCTTTSVHSYQNKLKDQSSLLSQLEKDAPKFDSFAQFRSYVHETLAKRKQQESAQ